MLDAHVHVWDTDALRYALFDHDEQLRGRRGLDDYLGEAGSLGVDRLLVVEAASAGADGLQEARWLQRELADSPRVAGLVAWAPLEADGLATYLDELLAIEGRRVVGIRRSFEFEDPGFPGGADVIRGAALAGERGLVVDLVLFARSLGACLDLVRSCPGTQFVLDHLGKPPISVGGFEPWASQLSALAECPNVAAKISGLATEAGSAWSVSDLSPYVEHALGCFGPERLMIGSDWPIVGRSGGVATWLDAVAELLAACSPRAHAQLYEGTARRVYGV
jgi:L-fuconolactonase